MTRMITVVKNEDNFRYTSFITQQKCGVESRMCNYGLYTFGGSRGKSYSGRVSLDGKFIFLYTAQKFRRKCEHKIIKPSKRAKVQEVRKESTPIRQAHWEVKVYKFPLDRVIEAKQLERTFKITIKQ